MGYDRDMANPPDLARIYLDAQADEEVPGTGSVTLGITSDLTTYEDLPESQKAILAEAIVEALRSVDGVEVLLAGMNVGASMTPIADAVVNALRATNGKPAPVAVTTRHREDLNDLIRIIRSARDHAFGKDE